MGNEPIDISSKPIKVFLDKVDTVLNSNTFLLRFEVKTANIDENLLTFIRSESFIHQLEKQDNERGWFNMHYFDHEAGIYKFKHGNILTGKINLKLMKLKAIKVNI